MRTEKVMATATIFEIEELQAMAKVEEVLAELERTIGVQHTLMSTETGECVGMAEIARVRGILAALQAHRCWEVSHDYFSMFG